MGYTIANTMSTPMLVNDWKEPHRTLLVTHKFSPQGVSGVAILAESHISVHTWPEIGYGAFDVFMCGDAEPMKAVGVLSRAFGTMDVRVKELLRGDGVVLDAGVAA